VYKESQDFYEALALDDVLSSSIGCLSKLKQQYNINQIAAYRKRRSTNGDADNMLCCIEFMKFVQEENLKLDEMYNICKSSSGMGKLRPAGQVRPVERLNAVRGRSRKC
jgi:hypothetical protein